MPGCICCDGKGHVPDIDGNDRPCSRCRVDDFEDWLKRRRPGRPEKPAEGATHDDDGEGDHP